jgi:DNA-binding transcriptional MerR regulator
MPLELQPRYSLTELADLAGVTPRTVRYYISQGLLSVDATPGPGPKYDDGHLARLRLIKRLQREHQPLAEIRRQLDAVDDATVLALAEADELPAARADSALDYIRRLTGGRARALRVAEASPDALYIPAPRLASTGPAAPAAHVLPEAPSSMPAPTPVVGSVIPAALTASTSNRIERSQWERVELAPDVELHLRRPMSRATAKRVDRLIAIARDLFREDPS